MCASEEEFQKWVSRANVNLIFTNQFFEASDYTSPVKMYLDDTFYWPLIPNLNKLTNIYIKKQ